MLTDLERHREAYAENVLRRPDSAARRVVCAPCRKGEHVDHHHGVWRRFDGTSPVVCPCERCGEAGSQGALF